jgi:hypothetical protein
MEHFGREIAPMEGNITTSVYMGAQYISIPVQLSTDFVLSSDLHA